MAKRKETDQLDHMVKKSNNSNNDVFYEPATIAGRKINKVSLKNIQNRPIYKCFIHYHSNTFPHDACWTSTVLA